MAIILYKMLKSCMRGRFPGSGRTPGITRRPHRPSDWRPNNWFGGGGGGRGGGPHDPPPPYTPYSKPSNSSDAQGSAWTPGFWTGAALAGLGAHLFNNNRAARPNVAYDWEQERLFRAPPRAEERSFGWGSSPRRRPSAFDTADRGEEGSSNLGSMRRSTGLGGSNVR